MFMRDLLYNSKLIKVYEGYIYYITVNRLMFMRDLLYYCTMINVFEGFTILL